MTQAMEVAATQSEVVWNSTGNNWKAYQWFGYTFKGRYVLNTAYKWKHQQDDGVVAKYCDFFKALATQAPGIYALHCPYLDFNTICPSSDLSSYVYINQLRLPSARLVSHLLFRQSCVCESNMPRCQTESDWKHERGGETVKKEEYCSWQADGLINDAIRGDNVGGTLNLYTTYFCGLSGIRRHRQYCGYQPSSPEALELAKVNMQRQFAWVGILEEPTISYETLAAILPTFFGPNLFTTPGHVVHPGDAHDPNAAVDRSALRSDTTVKLKEHLSNDYQLYQYAIELLHHRSVKLINNKKWESGKGRKAGRGRMQGMGRQGPT
jgi:hypothetical protein